MVEMWLVVAVIGTSLGSGLFGAFLWSYLFNWRLESKIMAFNNKHASAMGVTAKAQLSAEDQQRMIEAVAEFTQLRESGMGLPQIAGVMLPKYMDILPHVMKEMGIKFSLKDIMRNL